MLYSSCTKEAGWITGLVPRRLGLGMRLMYPLQHAAVSAVYTLVLMLQSLLAGLSKLI